MANLNRVLLIGNCTRDPDLKYTPKGTAVCEIGLAVNRITTDDNGKKHESVTFIDVTLWNRQAEIAGEYLKKGRQVFVEGRLTLDVWDDKQSGQKRSKLKVVGENIQLLGSKPNGEAEGHTPERTERAQQGRREAQRPSAPPPKRNSEDPDWDVGEFEP